jgi:hypothetical protein
MQKHKHKSVPRADNIFPPESKQAKARRLLTERVHRDARRVIVTFDVQHDHLPALWSVIEEMGGIVVARMAGKHTPPQEQALTAAAVALGLLRAAVSVHSPAVDPNF